MTKVRWTHFEPKAPPEKPSRPWLSVVFGFLAGATFLVVYFYQPVVENPPEIVAKGQEYTITEGDSTVSLAYDEIADPSSDCVVNFSSTGDGDFISVDADMKIYMYDGSPAPRFCVEGNDQGKIKESLIDRKANNE